MPHEGNQREGNAQSSAQKVDVKALTGQEIQVSAAYITNEGLEIEGRLASSPLTVKGRLFWWGGINIDNTIYTRNASISIEVSGRRRVFHGPDSEYNNSAFEKPLKDAWSAAIPSIIAENSEGIYLSFVGLDDTQLDYARFEAIHVKDTIEEMFTQRIRNKVASRSKDAAQK